MDATLTATGVIATILSVIFAFAAYFVQHKKNNLGKNNSKVSGSEGQDSEAHVVTTRHGVSKEKKRRIADSSLNMETSSPLPEPGDPDQGQKPLFKKYSAKGGGYEENAGFADEDEALWE